MSSKPPMSILLQKPEYQTNLPMFEGNNSYESLDGLIDYLNSLKEKGYVSLIFRRSLNADEEYTFSAVRYVDKTDAELIQELGLDSVEEKRIYDALKSKYEN
jgi:hypothetical protein